MLAPRPRRLRGLTAVAVAVLLSASCGSSPPVESTGPPPTTALLEAGAPGWSATVAGAPAGRGQALVWTGDRLVVAGYGAGKPSGVLQVATYSPETGDWTAPEAPFGEDQTVGPVLGHDLEGRVYLVAGACGRIDEGYDLLPGQCPYIRRMIRVLDDTGWSDVEVTSDAQNPKGRDGDATQFTGPRPDGAGFDIEHRPFVVTGEQTTALAPPPVEGMEHLCSTSAGTLSVQFATTDGDPTGLNVLRQPPGRDRWDAVALPDALVTMAASLEVGGPGVLSTPGCHDRGVTLFVVRARGRSTAFTARFAAEGRVRWSECTLPEGTISPLAQVVTDDSAYLAGATVSQVGTTNLVRCGSSEEATEGELLSDQPGYPPDILVLDTSQLILIARPDDDSTELSVTSAPA